MSEMRSRSYGRHKLRAMLRGNRPAIGFMARFFLYLGGLFILLGLDLGFNRVLASLLGSILSLMGAETKTLGSLVLAKGFSFSIDNACAGVVVTIIYLSAVLAYPAKWKEKARGILFGVVAIQIVNLVRIIALFYIKLWFPTYFDGAHVYAAQVLVIGFAVAFWLFWAERLPRPARS